MEHALYKILNDQEFVAWYYHAYNSKTLDQCSAAELREALSYYYHTKSDNPLVVRILDAVKYNTSFSWCQPELSLIDEAYLVKLLREAGYELPLFEDFPNNSFDLRTKSKKTVPVTKFKKLRDQFEGIKRKFIGEQHYFSGTFVIAGLIHFSNWHLFIWLIFLTWVLWAIIEFPKHDYFEHRYVIARNETIRHTIDFILYLVHPGMYADRSGWLATHVNHHKHWKGEKDVFTTKLNDFKEIVINIFQWRFFAKPNPVELNKIIKEHQSCAWIFQYIPEIRMFLFLSIILLFGFENFFYLVLIPVTSKIIFDGQHDWYLKKFGERNYWFLFPITLNQSWHLYHHENYRVVPRTWNDIFLGPRWVKYINPQYYVARLLFKFKN